MKANGMQPKLSPAGEEMVMRLVEHLDNDPNAGAYVILSRQCEGDPEIGATACNIDGQCVMHGVRFALTDVVSMLHRCMCGEDHAGDIAKIERALALLSGTVVRLQ